MIKDGLRHGSQHYICKCCRHSTRTPLPSEPGEPTGKESVIRYQRAAIAVEHEAELERGIRAVSFGSELVEDLQRAAQNREIIASMRKYEIQDRRWCA